MSARNGGLLLGTLLLASCGEDSAVPPAATHALAWVAPAQTQHGEACRNCHPEIARSWSGSGMARSLGPVEAEEFPPLTQLDPVQDGAGYRYAFARSPEGTPLLIETHKDHPDHARPSALAFAIGSGEHDRSYAAAVGPLMAFAPLEVLTSDAGRHAALAPGNSMQAGARFDSPIGADCLRCHTDSLPAPNWPEDLGPDPANWSPRGISCGACHGAVAQHASAQATLEAGGSLEATGGSLPKLSALSRIERVSVCAACHLQGDASIELLLGAHGLPKVGGDLLDSRAIFVATKGTKEIGFVSQVERLALSRCFSAAPEMDCSTCHDPHQSLHSTADNFAVRRSVRDACVKCHEPEDCATPAERRAQGDCASCHMPSMGVFDVAEVQIHDHYIRRDAPRGRGPTPANRLRVEESPTGDWRLFSWPGEAPPAYTDDPGLWLLALGGRGHEQRATSYLDQALGARSSALPHVHHARGLLLERAGRTEEAEDAYRAAFALDQAHAQSAINLALILQRSERTREGLNILDKVIARFPQAEGALRNRAILRLDSGDTAGMAADLEAAFWIRPSAAIADKLAEWLQSTGNSAEARRWRAAAASVDPAY